MLDKPRITQTQARPAAVIRRAISVGEDRANP